MQNHLVSIIIPTYNRAHLIGETLESVLAQTYPNWECIVVDDGSTDATDELLEFYCKKDSRFSYNHRPKDRPKGANACRNYGFEMSKGEYVNWFDSDDLISNEFLLQKLKIFNNSVIALDIVFCESQTFIVEKGKIIILNKYEIKYSDFLEDFVLRKFFLNTASAMWHSEYLRNNHNKFIFDESLSQSQDYDLYFRSFLNQPKYYVINQPLLNYRKTEHSISVNFKKNNSSHIQSFLLVKKKILEAYREDTTVYRQILNQVTSALRNSLNSKDYKQSYLHLEFLKKHSFLINSRLTCSYLKIAFIYSLCRITGKGSYYFREYLKF